MDLTQTHQQSSGCDNSLTTTCAGFHSRLVHFRSYNSFFFAGISRMSRVIEVFRSVDVLLRSVDVLHFASGFPEANVETILVLCPLHHICDIFFRKNTGNVRYDEFVRNSDS